MFKYGVLPDKEGCGDKTQQGFTPNQGNISEGDKHVLFIRRDRRVRLLNRFLTVLLLIAQDEVTIKDVPGRYISWCL